MSSRETGFWVRLLVLVHLGLIAWQFSPDLCTNGDNAVYYALGESLAEGRGFRDIHLAGEPVDTSFPVLFPAFLAISHFFGDTPLLAKIMVALLGAFTLLLCYVHFRDSLSRPFMFAFLILVAASGLLADFNLVLMSEAMYVCVTLAALVLLHKSQRTPADKVLFWTAIAVSLMPAQTRSVGIFFSVAVVVAALIDRRFRYAIAHAVLFLCVYFVMKSLTGSETAPTESVYLSSPLLKDAYDPELGSIAYKDLLPRIVGNINIHLSLVFPKSYLPFAKPPVRWLWLAFANVLMGLTFAGWLRRLTGAHKDICLYVMFYAGVLLLWHIPNDRRIAAIMPLLLYFLVSGLEWVLVMFDPRRGAGFWEIVREGNVLAVPRLTLLRTSILWAIVVVAVGLNIDYRIRNTGAGLPLTKDWRNFYSCADWMRINTPREAVVMSRKPELFFVRSQRKGMIYPYTHNVESILEAMRRSKVTHVVYDNFYWTKTTVKYVHPVLLSHPELFRVVYALKDPDMMVLEFVDK